MKIENKIPKVFVISETKINPQSSENAIKEVKNVNWQEVWKKRNLNTQLTDMEKIPEIISEITQKFENDNLKTEEYNKELLAIINDESPFLHLFVSVAFINVSRQFSFSFQNFNGSITVGTPHLETFSFWVPPSFETDKELLFEYGKVMHQYMNEVEKLQAKAIQKNKDFVVKTLQAVVNMHPSVSQLNIVATTHINEWKKYILNNTAFTAPDENRYVFCQLFRLFCLKWPTLFSDLQLVDLDGNRFEVDTLQSNPHIFKGLQVIYHPIQQK